MAVAELGGGVVRKGRRRGGGGGHTCQGMSATGEPRPQGPAFIWRQGTGQPPPPVTLSLEAAGGPLTSPTPSHLVNLDLLLNVIKEKKNKDNNSIK